MVYKKYIKRGDKKYGPYLYQNKRVGERVITSYEGKSSKEKNFLTTAVLGLLILGI